VRRLPRLGILTGLLLLLALGCQAVQGFLPTEPAPSPTARATLVFTLEPTATPLPPTVTPQPTPTATLAPLVAPVSHTVWLPLLLKAYGVSEAGELAPAALTASPTPTATPIPDLALTVPILMYHYVSPLPADADTIRQDLTVTPEAFAAQLAYLREQGYTSITLFDLAAALRGEASLPEKPIVLTFDDGYADTYTVVFPLLQQYGFKGTFFVIAYVVEGGVPGYLTWEQAREMAEAGMSIQSHSLDHVDLRERSADFLKQQVELSRALIEARVGQPVRFFCYPAGRYDEATIQALDQAGYWGAVTTEWGSQQTWSRRFTWPRLRVRGAWDLETFKQILP